MPPAKYSTGEYGQMSNDSARDKSAVWPPWILMFHEFLDMEHSPTGLTAKEVSQASKQPGDPPAERAAGYRPGGFTLLVSHPSGRPLGNSAKPPPDSVEALAFSSHHLQRVLFGLSVCCVLAPPSDWNIFVISLSVADMLVAVYPYPMTLIAILNNGWTMGKLHCQLSSLITSISAVSSVFNIMVIALNRYCYICHSLLYEKIFTGRNSILILIVTWLMTMLALIPTYYVTTVQYNPQVYTCSFVYTSSAFYAFGMMALHFLIPLTVVAFCYLRIWILVIQVNHRVKVTKPKFMLVDVRNFMTMFLVFVLFALCWGPLNFIKLARVFDPLGVGPSIPEWMYIGSYYLAYFNSCVNAMIYGTLNQNFRKEYQRIVRNTKESAYYFVVDLQEQIHEMRMRRKPTYAGARRIQGDTYL
ncbi:melatonin-related receptor [Gracilinanus agilis]|uniref:melatonin-related receptor n=1 Tax=Gracilinanus agilis TaxID=191870 RepID=UPI001CFE7CA0|nr:melatonin-related receptor [Gracilinanus agilis]